ncbi:hypothetical protein EJB05_09523 [Eragrostis curvula]|uniref:Uncharacterized protein n=1 Tax=Eragrostis curvula TaxID=38414 RepID=A0A5J9W565_9POAL|nr:hypothetical protein EJB05_09523 [Eragrostis curvula]
MVLKLKGFMREVMEDGLKLSACLVLPSGMPLPRVLAAVAMLMVVGDKLLHRFVLDGLPAMVQAVRSDDPAVQLESIPRFRKLLSIVMS